MAYLRLDKDLAFDEDWVKEMKLVGKGQCDMEYCDMLGREAQTTAKYVEDHGVNFVHHDEENASIVTLAIGKVLNHSHAGPPRVQDWPALCLS